jgi:hypothetical protein
LTAAPADSVVAQRGRYFILVSARAAEEHLRTRLAANPHIKSDSALLQTIRAGVANVGWVRLVAVSDDAQQRQDVLLAALLEKGSAGVRRAGSSTFADLLAVRPWGTCEMVNGRRFLLPDSSEILRTLDGWHVCPAA